MLLKVLDVCVCVWVNEWVYRVCLAFAFSFAFRCVRFAYIFIYIFLFNKFNLPWVSFGCLYACLPACLGIILEFSVWSLFNIFLHAFSLCLPISPYSYGNYEWELNREKKTTTITTTTITATAAVTLASFSLNSTLYTLYLPLSCTSFDVDTGPCYVFTVLCVLNSSKSQIYWKHINKRYTLLSVYMPYTLYIYTYDIAKRTRKTRSASVLPSNILNRIIYKRAVCAFSIFIFLCFLLFRLLFSVVLFFSSFHFISCSLRSVQICFSVSCFTHSSAFRFLL